MSNNEIEPAPLRLLSTQANPDTSYQGSTDAQKYFDFGHVPLMKSQNQHQSGAVLASQANDYTKEQMALSQQYEKEIMALENQYAIDAENRANAYNSPLAKIARGQAAGMSATAALGNNGVGEMSVSSAPSGSAPGAPGASPGQRSDGGVSGLDVIGFLAKTAISAISPISGAALATAQAGKLAAETSSIELDNFMKQFDALVKPFEVKGKISDAKVSLLRNAVTAAWHEGGSKSKAFEVLNAKLENIELDGELKQGIKGLTLEQTNTELSKQAVYDSEAALNEAKSLTENQLRDARLETEKQQAEMFRQHALNFESNTLLTDVERTHLQIFKSKFGDGPVASVTGLVKRLIEDGSNVTAHAYNAILNADLPEKVKSWFKKLSPFDRKEYIDSFIRNAETFK